MADDPQGRPARAAPGILTGLVLGLGRAIGETAAVIFTAGSSLRHVVPTSLLEGTRTLSVHFYQLAREGISAEKAYATAAVLVLAISLINVRVRAMNGSCGGTGERTARPKLDDPRLRIRYGRVPRSAPRPRDPQGAI